MPDAHFLLGYHDLMMGYRNAALDQFAIVVKEASQDKIAQHILAELRAAGGRTPKTAGISQPLR